MIGQYHKSVLAVQNKWKGEMNLIFAYAYNYNLDLKICIHNTMFIITWALCFTLWYRKLWLLSAYQLLSAYGKLVS